MQKLKNALAILLTLSLSPCSIRASASEINLHPSNEISCLTREQKEQIEVCFEENLSCHQALNSTMGPPKPSWELIALGIAAGMVTGLVIDAQIHH